MIDLPILDPNEVGGDGAPGPKQWRSFAQLHKDPGFTQAQKEEFGAEALEAPTGANRRQFLQLMGASMALAGLTACRRPEVPILPYTRAPEEIIEGVPLYYATAMPFRGSVRALLVETYEGRPTKVEGNPQHPVQRGRTGPFEQASVLNLYDPDRSKKVLQAGKESSLNQFINAARQLATQGAQRRVAVIAEDTGSPAVAEMRRRLQQRYPNLVWIDYSPEGDDARAQGMQAAFGRPLRPFFQITKQSVIASFDDDFLGPQEPNFVQNQKSYADSRDIRNGRDTLSRMYVAESAYTITGAKADHRRRLRSTDVSLFAAAVAERIGVATGGLGQRFANDPMVAAMAEDLRRAGPNAIVTAGETQPAWVHALAAAMNSALGSIGRGVLLVDPQQPARAPQNDLLRQLVASIGAGQVDTLIMLDANPVYSAPGDLNFAEAIRRVQTTIHLGEHVDETAQVSQWHVPLTHFMEAWGDGRAYDGTLSIIQPLIHPLYEDALSPVEFLNVLTTGVNTPGYELLRQYYQANPVFGGDFEEGWRRALHDGFVPNTAYPAATGGATFTPVQLQPTPEDAIEVVFRLDTRVLDGRYANNPWLQELPDQTNKVVWDNYALMSRATAERLGIEVQYDAGKYYADVIELGEGRGAIRLPAWIAPGHPDNSITVTFGYGRAIRTSRELRKQPFFETENRSDVFYDGPVANEVGTNVYPLRPSTANRVILVSQDGIRQVDDGYMIVTTQEHGSMEGRPVIRQATLAEFVREPNFADHEVPPLAGKEPWAEYPELWRDQHPEGQTEYYKSPYAHHQWGMSIDLNRCTGCSACAVACQSENNIPVVGKDQVSRGREMNWLRIDRYYISPERAEAEEPGFGAPDGGAWRFEMDDAEMAFQPMFCVHCENAPCEPVCPVYATTHSPDGLNEMTYNRCIGTRYCANNCPYKVRRFNYHNWTKTLPAQVQMQQNPRVTVRFRGVMEKCTYCVQRIREVGRKEIIEDRPMRDGEVLTACQQACPADAIVFGDINDPNSQVTQVKASPRNYLLLAELNTQPRTSFQSVVKNPNPRLSEALA